MTLLTPSIGFHRSNLVFTHARVFLSAKPSWIVLYIIHAGKFWGPNIVEVAGIKEYISGVLFPGLGDGPRQYDGLYQRW